MLDLSDINAPHDDSNLKCRLCKDDGVIGEIDIPYIFKYLVTELALCNINVKIQLKKV